MSIPLEPYLDTIRAELATTLVSGDTESVSKSARYSQRMLGMLLQRRRVIPLAEKQALEKFDSMLDDLCAEVGALDGGMMLVAELTQHIRTRPDYACAESALQTAVLLLSAHPNARKRKLQGQIAAVNFELHNSFFQAALNDAVGAATASVDESLNADQQQALQAWLRQEFPTDPLLQITGVRALSGGASKKTLVVELDNVTHLPQATVVRMDKAAGVAESTVVDEYFLLQLTHSAGLPVPVPYALESSGKVLGAPFVLLSYVEGRNIGDWTEVTEPSREFAVDVAHTLARLHQIPEAAVQGRLPGADSTTRERMQRDMQRFENTWRASGQPSIVLEQAYAWLKEHLELAEGRRSIVHCDPGIHNMVARDGRLAALLDWETAVIGNPAQDLTYMRPKVNSMIAWEDFLHEYQVAGGVLPSAGEMDFYELWRGVFSMHFNSMARAFYLSGMASSLVLAYVSQNVYHFFYQDLHDTVNRIYQRYS